MTSQELNLLTKIVTESATADDFLAVGDSELQLWLFFSKDRVKDSLLKFGIIAGCTDRNIPGFMEITLDIPELPEFLYQVYGNGDILTIKYNGESIYRSNEQQT
jgi:hypothetical protein